MTAFEVIEYVADPVEFVRDALTSSGGDSLVFTADLFGDSPPKCGDWWHYAFETSQNILFYQRRTVTAIAGRLGSKLYCRGAAHMLTNRRINPTLFATLANRHIAQLFFFIPLIEMTSRTMADHLALIRHS